MYVKEIMQENIISVRQGTSLSQIIGLFQKFHDFPVVPVVTEENVLVGIVRMRNLFDGFKPSNQDILMRNPLAMLNRESTDIFDIEIEEGMGLLVIAVDIMDTKMVKIHQDKSIKEGYDLMQFHSRDSIPVVDGEGKLVGLISIFDVLMKVFNEKGIA